MKSQFKLGVAGGSAGIARAAEAGGADFLLAIKVGPMRIMRLPSISCILPMIDYF